LPDSDFNPFTIKHMNTKLLIGVIFGSLTIGLTGQPVQLENSNELYFSVSPISPRSYGIQYKYGLSTHTAFRVALTNINIGYNSYIPAETNQFSNSDFVAHGGIEFGLEKRYMLADKIGAFYGFDFVFYGRYGHGWSNNPNLPIVSRQLNDISISPGLGFKSGFIATIKNGFSASAEISPQLLYNHSSHDRVIDSKVEADKSNALGFNMDFKSVKISLLYQWGKR